MENNKQSIKALIEEVKGLSPFELKDELIKLAKDTEKKGTAAMLNAGRGNPNWTAATPRQAFFTFGQFAVKETQDVWCDGDLAGMPMKAGIYDRFIAYVNTHKTAEGIDLLADMIEYGIKTYGFDPDTWVHELVDGIIGDNYPVPDRMLVCIERVVHDYIVKEMGGQLTGKTSHDIFAVEGGTAAMCYIFNTLMCNKLISKGDDIALMVPIFTPYIEIAELSTFNFNVTQVVASGLTPEGRHTWQYPKEELDKLADPKIKMVCIVNPSNPPSVAMDKESVEYLKKIVKEKNPNLLIITDDVYGTFVDNFESLMVSMPYNTLGVYSYSKYFGVTGWRLGVIGLAHDNVYDKLLAELPEEDLQELDKRYSALTTEPRAIKFIDRLVADSRQVALNHTAGLSTPQQVQMAMFSLFALLDTKDIYKKQTKEICIKRNRLVYNELEGLSPKDDKLSAAYYNEYDLLVWARLKYGESFVEYLEAEHDVLEFLFELAQKYGIVLLNGSGFDGPGWSIRVSLANLQDEEYTQIGKGINELFNEYAQMWKVSQKI